MAAPAYLRPAIYHAAARYQVDPHILSRLLAQESGYQENRVSPAGARDIAQFIPSTAAQYHVTLGDNRATDDIYGAAHYLSDALHQTGGSYAKALSIYNSGSPTGYLRIPETRNYVHTILGGGNIQAAGGAYGRAGGQLTATPGQVKGAGFNGGTGDSGAAGLAALLGAGQQRQVVPSVPLQDPATSATRYLRTAGGSAAGGIASGGPAPRQGLDPAGLLAALGSQGGIPQATATPGSVKGAAGAAAPSSVTRARGTKAFDGKPVAAWIAPILSYARARGWTGTVTSGYRSYQQQAGIYNSGVRPAAKPGTSNHEFTAYPGGAVDVSQSQQLARILQRSPYAGVLVWAGGKDPVHFSHPGKNGSY